jgi:hypothetical protein
MTVTVSYRNASARYAAATTPTRSTTRRCRPRRRPKNRAAIDRTERPESCQPNVAASERSLGCFEGRSHWRNARRTVNGVPFAPDGRHLRLPRPGRETELVRRRASDERRRRRARPKSGPSSPPNRGARAPACRSLRPRVRQPLRPQASVSRSKRAPLEPLPDVRETCVSVRKYCVNAPSAIQMHAAPFRSIVRPNRRCIAAPTRPSSHRYQAIGVCRLPTIWWAKFPRFPPGGRCTGGTRPRVALTSTPTLSLARGHRWRRV